MTYDRFFEHPSGMESKAVAQKLLDAQKEACNYYNRLLQYYKGSYTEDRLRGLKLEKIVSILHLETDANQFANSLEHFYLKEFSEAALTVQERAKNAIKMHVASFLSHPDDANSHFHQNCRYDQHGEYAATEALQKTQGGFSPKQKRFSKEVIDILEKTFINSPYPSELEKSNLAMICNLSTKQISNWFTNKRNRTKM